MAKIRTAVVGASGYSGEELIRLLIRHPHCKLKIITSRQYAGQPVSEVFPRFTGAPLCFSKPEVERIAAECDVAFLALPHGLATEYAIPLLEAGVKVIDISADFRLNDPEKYRKYYKEDHPASQLLAEAVYGLPEIYRESIRGAELIACPGCYPTSIILPAAPLLAAKAAKPEGIVVASMSGVSGAGRKVDLPFIFPECNESLRAYSATGHRHLPEIEQELAIAAKTDALAINFVPHLVPVTRGINSTVLLDAVPDFNPDKLPEIYQAAYQDETFARVLKPGKLSDTKYVVMSNCCEIGYVYDDHTGKIIVTGAIDNLTKGASGQAVQCFNIRFGLPETTGLL